MGAFGNDKVHYYIMNVALKYYLEWLKSSDQSVNDLEGHSRLMQLTKEAISNVEDTIKFYEDFDIE